MYEIKKNVPVPIDGLGRPNKYPFKNMEAGDCFDVPPEEYARTQAAASHFGSRKGMKFSTRKQQDGSYRVWRVS